MPSKQNILFRADSSSTIGTGHIMRDLVLASKYKNSNIIFAVQDLDGNINYKIKEDGYQINYKYDKRLKIMLLDDTYEKHNCNILLNHNISGDQKRYKELVPKDWK